MSWASKKSDDATFWQGCHKSLLSAALGELAAKQLRQFPLRPGNGTKRKIQG
jgi:hypothetical protein